MSIISDLLSPLDHESSWPEGSSYQMGWDTTHIPPKHTPVVVCVPDMREKQGSTSPFSSKELLGYFDSLFPHHWTLFPVFAGKLASGATFNDTLAAVSSITQELIRHELIPVFVGGSQALTLGMYDAFAKLELTINLTSIDPRLDFTPPGESHQEHSYLYDLILDRPEYLFSYHNIGGQRHFISDDERDLIDRLFFFDLPLGEVQTRPESAEPILRDTDLLSVDMNSLRASDFSANSYHSPHGLNGELLCRLMRYAGMSDKMQGLGLFNMAGSDPVDHHRLAQLIWYFTEGLNSRLGDHPVGSRTEYEIYRVSMDEFKDEIVFLKSSRSGRWWIEIPHPKSGNSLTARHALVPCSYEDYERAMKNEMPDIWWRAWQRLA